MQTFHQTAVFAVGCALASIHAAVLIRGIKLADVRSRIKTIWASWASRKKSQAEDPLAAHVAEMVRAGVLEQARQLYKTGALFLQMMTVGLLVTWPTSQTSWLTDSLEIIFLIVYFGVITCVYVPGLLRLSTIAIWYSCFMVAMLMSPLAVPKEILPTLCNGLMVLRFMLGLSCLNMQLVAFMNFAFWLMASFWYAWNTSSCEELPSNSVFITCEFWSAVVLTLSLQAVRANMVAVVRRDIEAKASYSEHSAVKSILLTLCDAVVELDTEFKIAESAQELACMLLHGSGRSLLGVPFISLMASDDDQRNCFNFLSNERDNGTSRASAFHAHMHDSLNSRLHVEMFHMNFRRGLDNNLHHLIGVREYTDAPPVQNLNDLPERRSSGSLPDWETWSQDGEVPCFNMTSASYYVSFDAFTFSILDCSAGFIGLCGSDPFGKILKDWVVEDVKEHFLQQYAEAVNDFMHTDEVSDGLLFQNLPLVIPVSAAARLELSALCHIKFCLPESCNRHNSELEVVATAKFPNLIPRKLSKNRHRNNRIRKQVNAAASDSETSSEAESFPVADTRSDDASSQSHRHRCFAPKIKSHLHVAVSCGDECPVQTPRSFHETMDA